MLKNNGFHNRHSPVFRFNPLTLFSGGTQGAWYDPSDFTTMFQDSAGTIPVTAVAQPVGRILDKSGNGNHASQSASASKPVLQIDENGNYYLAFDGIDDSMLTSSINFTTTDKISLFTGLRRTQNGGIPIELSSAVGTNPGSFYVFAGNRLAAAGPVWTTSSRGSIADNPNQAVETAAIYNAPLTNLVTGLYSISGDSTTLRINGAQVGVATGEQGAGNYGNYPLYIGRRNNASLAFNGRLYSLVLVGKSTTSYELSNTESYVNRKTGAY